MQSTDGESKTHESVTNGCDTHTGGDDETGKQSSTSNQGKCFSDTDILSDTNLKRTFTSPLNQNLILNYVDFPLYALICGMKYKVALWLAYVIVTLLIIMECILCSCKTRILF